MGRYEKVFSLEILTETIKRNFEYRAANGKPLMNIKVLLCTPQQDFCKFLDSMSIEYSYIDALTMTRKELRWTSYGDINAQSDWYKKLIETKVLVIDNFGELPEKSDSDERHGDDRPTQNDYRFLFYNANDTTPTRVGADYEIPLDIIVYIINRTNSQYEKYRVLNNFTPGYSDISELNLPG